MLVRLSFQEAEVMRSLSNLIKANCTSYHQDCSKRIWIKPFEKHQEGIKENTTKSDGEQEEATVTLTPEQQQESILEQAKEEAKQILKQSEEEAKQEKERLKKEREKVLHQAKEEGFQKGYEDGKKEFTEKEEQLEVQKKENQVAYQKKLEQLEPHMIQLLITYLEKITGVFAEEHREIIFHLLHRAIQGLESSKTYCIKLSEQDYEEVKKKEEDIKKLFKADATVQIKKDSALQKNECQIELDSGVTDCSLNIQLKNLILDLKLMARISS